MNSSRLQSPESIQPGGSKSSLRRMRTVSNATDDASDDSQKNTKGKQQQQERAIAGPEIVDLANDDETITDDDSDCEATKEASNDSHKNHNKEEEEEEEEERAIAGPDTVDLSIETDDETITDDDSDYEATKEPSSASLPQDPSRRARTTSITDLVRPAKRKRASRRPVEHGIVDEAYDLVTSATKQTLLSKLESVRELFSAPGKQGGIPNASTIHFRWRSLLQNKLKPKSPLQIQCQTYVEQNFKRNRGNRGPHKKIDVQANTDFIEKHWNGKKFLILPKKPASGSFEETFDPQDFPEWEIFQTYEYISHSIFVKEGLRNRLKPRALKDNTNAQRAETVRGEKRVVTLEKIYCYPDKSERQPIRDKPRTSDKKYPGASVFLLARIEDKKE